MELSSKILSDLVIYMKYARYLPEENRRETWKEIVSRNRDMHIKKYPQMELEIINAYQYVYTKQVLPSMRSLQFGGKPIELSPSRLFNCATISMDHPATFSEIMFLLLGGSGVGCSIQKHHVEQLPPVRKPLKRTRRHLIGDNIEGWADAIKKLMKAYFFGLSDPTFDFSDIRAKGELLKTSGGLAPGPQPLKDCLHNIRGILDKKDRDDKLTPLNVHDIICHIADAVLSGGIRRAACACIFSLDDHEMLYCKSGDWQTTHPFRGRSNNSAMLLRHRIKEEDFARLWEIIERNKTGEPAFLFSNSKEIFCNPCQPKEATVLTPKGISTIGEIKPGDTIWGGNRWTRVLNKWSNGIKRVFEYQTADGVFVGTIDHKVVSKGEKIPVDIADSIDKSGVPWEPKGETTTLGITYSCYRSTEEVFDITVDDEDHTYWSGGLLVSNCFEASMGSNQFCNLATVNVSDIANQSDLNDRTRVAAFLTTLQAGYTDFHYLRDVWKRRTEKEALIGVSMTGLANDRVLALDFQQAAKGVVEENKRVARLIGINPAARTTLVKPEGSSSLVVGSSSGIHAWYAPFYIRRLRVLKNEPIYQYIKTKLPQLVEDDLFNPNIQAVLSVPIKAPKGAIFRDEKALDALARVKHISDNWIKPGHISGDNRHNVSCTVNIKDHEWPEVGQWMWENRDSYNGLSTFPYDDSSYQQAPHEECSEEKYLELLGFLKKIDLSEVEELVDLTNFKEQSACAGGKCDVV